MDDGEPSFVRDWRPGCAGAGGGADRTRHAYSMSAWLKRDIPPKANLLGHFFHRTSRGLLCGDTGTGKSLLALDWAYCTASRQPFFHWGAGEGGSVLYIDTEMGAEETQDRLRTLENRYGVCDDLITLSFEDFPNDDLSIDTDAGQRWIEARVSDLGAVGLFYDNLMTGCAGSLKEEETAASIATFSRRLSARRIGQLLIHHTGHDTSRIYGSKGLAIQQTFMIQLSRVAATAGLSMRLEFTKARGKRRDTVAEFAPVTLSFDNDEWTCDQSQASHRPSQRSLTVNQKAALKVIREAIDEIGEVPPASSRIPSHRKCIHRDKCDPFVIATFTASENKHKREGWRRGLEGLAADGAVGFHNGWIWMP